MSNGSGLKPGRTTIEKKVKLYKVYNWLCIIRSNNYKTTQNIDPKITDFCSNLHPNEGAAISPKCPHQT